MESGPSYLDGKGPPLRFGPPEETAGVRELAGQHLQLRDEDDGGGRGGPEKHASPKVHLFVWSAEFNLHEQNTVAWRFIEGTGRDSSGDGGRSAAVSKQITEAGGQFVAGLRQWPPSAGKPIFVTAGPESATSAISLYLTGVMGRTVIPMGTDVTKSSLLKIAGNIVVVVSFMEVLSEAHVFAEKAGLGSPVLENMVLDMFGSVLESYSKRVTCGLYAPPPQDKAGFDVALAMKDLRHALT
ncbi:hypothetical protein CSHISOI_07378, partial [Colletotrichum shisoi]